MCSPGTAREGDPGECDGDRPGDGGRPGERALSRLRIDAADRIVSVDPAWKEWAERDGDPSLVDSVVGTDLWSHLAGLAVQQVYVEIVIPKERA